MGATGSAQFTLHLPDLLLKLGAQIGLIDRFDLIQSLLGCCLGLWDKQTPQKMKNSQMCSAFFTLTTEIPPTEHLPAGRG